MRLILGMLAATLLLVTARPADACRPPAPVVDDTQAADRALDAAEQALDRGALTDAAVLVDQTFQDHRGGFRHLARAARVLAIATVRSGGTIAPTPQRDRAGREAVDSETRSAHLRTAAENLTRLAASPQLGHDPAVNEALESARRQLDALAVK